MPDDSRARRLAELIDEAWTLLAPTQYLEPASYRRAYEALGEALTMLTPSPPPTGAESALQAALRWHAGGQRSAPDAPSVKHTQALVDEVNRLRARVGAMRNSIGGWRESLTGITVHAWDEDRLTDALREMARVIEANA